MRRYMKLYGMFMSQYMKKLMQSKMDFFIGFIAFFLMQASGIAFIYLVFDQIPDLAGYSFYQLLFVYGFAQIPRGIDHMFTDYLWMFSGRTIVRGDFDRYLLRPLNPLFQVIAEIFQPDGIGEVVIGIILLIIGSLKLNISYSILDIIALIFMVIFATLIYTSLKLFFASLAFWIKRSQSILYMFYMTSDFSKYPISIYNRSIRFFITYVVPFALTAYIPASYFIGESSLIRSLGLTMLMGSCLLAGSYYVFTRGMNRYESAGN